MLLQTLSTLYNRDLNRLYSEIKSYEDERRLWVIDKKIANSAGNLCLHLVGNLNTYIGKDLGNYEYIRDRDAEFSLKNIPQHQLLESIVRTKEIVIDTLKKLEGTDLQREFPELVFEKPTSVEYMLLHLSSHLTYHLGQINYHRRLLGEHS